MDAFKEQLFHQCKGPGGLKCGCCSPTGHSKGVRKRDKKDRTRKTARTRMKREFRKNLPE